MIKFVRLSASEQMLFAKRLGLLIKAGVPLLEGLRMLRVQAATHGARVIFDQLIADVEEGQFLSTSMKRFRGVFGEFAVNIIHVGEISGMLWQNLEYLAEELKKKHLLRRKVTSALLYPIFIVIATFGISGLLTIYIFPKILPLFAGLNITLPWTTRTLIFIHALLQRHGLLLLGLGAIAAFAVWRLLRIRKIKAVLHRGIIRLPLAGTIAQSYHMANFCRTLGLLLKSELTIVQAATITAKSITNLVYRREILLLSHSLTRGERLSTYLHERSNLFPAMVAQMISVGETTGNLGDTLLYVSELYEHELEEATKQLSTFLEPALMVVMGLLVGFVAISIITPIYEITQNIHP